MPSYSLTLREEKGFKLTTQELDDNFRYVLENASGSGTQGQQGPTGPSGGGGSGSIEIISLTISSSELTPTFLEPIEIIPAPGVGKMTVPLWGRFKMINGSSKWGDYFQLYPQSKDVEPGVQGKYLYSPLLSSTDKFFSINSVVSTDENYDLPDNEAWVLSVADDYISTTIILNPVNTAFEEGDLITGFQGATASVVKAFPVEKGSQEIYVNGVNGIFNVGETASGVPSGGFGQIFTVSNPSAPGDYDMELYLAYQTFNLL